MNEDILNKIIALLKHPKCVALGEIGLDFYYDFSDRDSQRYWFGRQLSAAKEFDMPVIIHDREAHSECFEMVKNHGVKGVFHCYSGSAEMASELIKLGFYISFTGVVTFKNAKKSIEVINSISLSQILIETDCPYLTPEPFRKNRNEPKYVCYTAQKIAEIKNISVEEVAKITMENTKRCFSIKC
jgi:TatD DNase family protein